MVPVQSSIIAPLALTTTVTELEMFCASRVWGWKCFKLKRDLGTVTFLSTLVKTICLLFKAPIVLLQWTEHGLGGQTHLGSIPCTITYYLKLILRFLTYKPVSSLSAF